MAEPLLCSETILNRKVGRQIPSHILALGHLGRWKMKRVVGISLGSSKRNHQAELTVAGQKLRIERIGTDGSMQEAKRLIRELDGQVNAFGLGGIDLYVWAGKRRYVLREAKQLARCAKKTPVVDGSGLKNSLERKLVQYLLEREPDLLKNKRILLTSAIDRFGLAESLAELDGQILYGDLMFVLGVPFPIYNLRVLQRAAYLVAPIVVQFPIKWIYPTGEKQNKQGYGSRFKKYFQWADIIAGDFHIIRKHMPKHLPGKTILTNTVTSEDIELLKDCGCSRLVTTTPSINGRSFGTNVIEATLVAVLGKNPEEITVSDYLQLLDQIGFEPRVEVFKEGAGAD